jgi:hypothetical protein
VDPVWGLYARTSWPYSGGARATDRCNRNRVGQVGAWTVKRWQGQELLACSSAGGGGVGQGRKIKFKIAPFNEIFLPCRAGQRRKISLK